ncbi:hypothetical protein [Paenibacillus sp. OSY-SE]|nr:hypothetical protein [Paenibacillus sp. OSY-SE]
MGGRLLKDGENEAKGRMKRFTVSLIASLHDYNAWFMMKRQCLAV